MKQKLVKNLGKFVLVGMIALAVPRPAHAQQIVADVIADAQEILNQINSAATAANTYISTTLQGTLVSNSFMQQIVSAWQQASDAVGKALQTQAAARIADTQSQNASVNVDKKTAQDIDRTLHTPSQESACAIAQAIRARTEMRDQAGAVAQGLSQGGGGRPTDPASVAKDTAAELASGLAPCADPGPTTQDTEGPAYHALGCQVKYNHKYEKKDTTITIFETLQFPVPDTYNPPANGIPMPLQSVSAEKYMPFLAAYSFCQNISPRLPPAPQATRGKITVDVAGIAAHQSMMTVANIAYGKCMKLLSERMQYGSEVPAQFQPNYLSQKTACKADAQIGIVDGDPSYPFSDGTSGHCSTAGRSLLQAETDRVNRDSANSYSSIYLQGRTPDGRGLDRSMANSDKIALKAAIDRSIDDLAQAINTAQEVAAIRSSPLGAPINQ